MTALLKVVPPSGDELSDPDLSARLLTFWRPLPHAPSQCVWPLRSGLQLVAICVPGAGGPVYGGEVRRPGCRPEQIGSYPSRAGAIEALLALARYRAHHAPAPCPAPAPAPAAPSAAELELAGLRRLAEGDHGGLTWTKTTGGHRLATLPGLGLTLMLCRWPGGDGSAPHPDDAYGGMVCRAGSRPEWVPRRIDYAAVKRAVASLALRLVDEPGPSAA
jgi:hypothetical protein